MTCCHPPSCSLSLFESVDLRNCPRLSNKSGWCRRSSLVSRSVIPRSSASAASTSRARSTVGRAVFLGRSLSECPTSNNHRECNKVGGSHHTGVLEHDKRLYPARQHVYLPTACSWVDRCVARGSHQAVEIRLVDCVRVLQEHSGPIVCTRRPAPNEHNVLTTRADKCDIDILPRARFSHERINGTLCAYRVSERTAPQSTLARRRHVRPRASTMLSMHAHAESATWPCLVATCATLQSGRA